jgi:hypothetical protein
MKIVVMNTRHRHENTRRSIFRWQVLEQKRGTIPLRHGLVVGGHSTMKGICNHGVRSGKYFLLKSPSGFTVKGRRDDELLT